MILVGMSVSPEMSEILVAVVPKPAKPGLENVKFVGYVICQNIVQLGDAVEQNLTVLEEAEALVAQSTAVLRSIRNAVDAERSWVYVKGSAPRPAARGGRNGGEVAGRRRSLPA